jgi:hypothetical protein
LKPGQPKESINPNNTIKQTKQAIFYLEININYQLMMPLATTKKVIFKKIIKILGNKITTYVALIEIPLRIISFYATTYNKKCSSKV